MYCKTTNFHQINLDDRFIGRSPRTQKIVLKSWAKDFTDIVFPAINEERFSVLYSDNPSSRPNTPVNFIVRALMLKELLGFADDELIDSICCDIRFQYALHTTRLPEQPVSDRIFNRFRERMYNHEVTTEEDLLTSQIMNLTQVYADFFNLISSLKRIDIMMIISNCKHMSRLEIIYTVVANAVKLIHRLDSDELIPVRIITILTQSTKIKLSIIVKMTCINIPKYNYT